VKENTYYIRYLGMMMRSLPFLLLIAGFALALMAAGEADAIEPEWSYEADDNIISVAVSADGEYIAAGTGGDGYKGYLFDKDSSTPLWEYTTGDDVWSVSVSADGKYIAAGSDDNKVYLFGKDSGTPLWSYATEENVLQVSISADGEYIAAGSNDGKVYLFDKDSSTPLWSYTADWSVSSVAISADGEYITAGSWDNKVYLFGKDSSTPLWSYEAGHIVWSVAISADGEYIVAGSDDYKVYLFNKDSSTPLWSYTTGDRMMSVAISADGEYIVAGGYDDKVYLFGKDSSTPLWSYETGDLVLSVAISADGNYIAASSFDDNVYLFGKDSSTPLWNYTTGSDVYSVAISADGEYIVAGSKDDKVYLFLNNLPPTAEVTRGLNLTAIDETQSIYPEYEGSSSQNSVGFKIILENTGTHNDTYIPELESTLEDGWSVTFWQDSGKTQAWPASGVDIEAGELDDLWVFVEIDDEADEGIYTIGISVRDEDDNPDAREEISLTVIVQRPELTISPDNIRLEIEGAIGNASMVKDGDSVVVLVDVENTGTADADDVRVEIFYYPKNAPTTQSEIDDLIILGFVFDEAKNKYIYVLYDREIDIESDNEKSIESDYWIIRGGEWYVEARADYDVDDSNGKILEPNENNNDARYSEPLRIKPDLSIDSMRIDSKYAGASPAQVPNIGDTVTFTVTVSNKGAADVQNARLYITADGRSDNEILIERSNKEYIKFDVDAGETTDVRFRWKTVQDEWSSFRAEVNPVCGDFDIQEFECESEGDGLSSETDRMFDELGRYANNEYPTAGVFEQYDGEVRFEVLPDFKIKKVAMDPSEPRAGEVVKVTVTIENIGNSDWQIGSKPLLLTFEDGVGTVVNAQIGESINKDDSIDVKFTWTVPGEDEDTLFLAFTIDAGSGSFEIQQCDTCDYSSPGGGRDNDEYYMEISILASGILDEEISSLSIIPTLMVLVLFVLFRKR